MILVHGGHDQVDAPATSIEICFWCDGDASTLCCLERVRWYRLHGHTAPPGLHSPREHT